MITKNGKGYSTFYVVGASKTSAQCKTKGYGGRYINKKLVMLPKRLSVNSGDKNNRGCIALYVTIRDTTNGGKQR